MHKLSVIIPAYNEEESITTALTKIADVDLSIHNTEKEIVIVNDGSRDRTREKIEEFISRNQNLSIRLINKENGGKGTAIRAGIPHCTGDIIIIQDADLEYDPSEYGILLAPILSGYADVVYGSRFIGGKPHRALRLHHYVANAFLTLLSNIATGIHLTDMETCYKALTRPALDSIKDNLHSSRFGIEPEITARIAQGKRWRVYEVGISYYGRTHAEGKKIGWKDGVAAIWYIIKYNYLTR